MKLLALSIFLVVIGSALAYTWVDIYRNNEQPCNSPINIDLPTDKNYYQLQILVENNNLTKDLDLYLWNNLKLENQNFEGNLIYSWFYTDCGSIDTYYDSTKCILFSFYMTWNEARSYCSNVYGGYLKDNLNAIDSSYLKSQTGRSEYWIGLSDFETPGTFAWDRGLNKPMEPLVR
uniref:C-type lectin domain-containing protein n=1 Tax=Acrobeloides nanus TaxID=290746 RepID=A0A914E8Y8_9BILA